ncbi:MAG: hypothetical protein GY845_18590 [Planctomycetes bacterium]|nr:hypothetical protein [Planctomycetota bacterium]
MITEKDIKRLRSKTSKYHIFGIKYIFPLMALIIFAVALCNIYLAIRYANYGNSTLRNILSFESHQQYSGWCMASLNRITLAAFLITVSLMYIILWLFGIAEIKFFKRMLNFIEFYTNRQKPTCSNQSLEEDGLNGRPSA